MFNTKELLAGIEAVISYRRSVTNWLWKLERSTDDVVSLIHKGSDPMFDLIRAGIIEEVAIVDKNKWFQVWVDVETAGYDVEVRVQKVFDHAYLNGKDKLFIVVDGDEITIADYR